MNVLNPMTRIKAQFLDAMKAHGVRSEDEAMARAKEMFERVKLPERFLDAYPHQLSGGMRQRAVIALSVVLKPKLLFLDEPTTALDVVVQRSIIELLNELRQEFGFGVVFITHDLSLLVEIADRIAIMYAGAIIEEAPAKELYEHPDHPYTIGLMNAFPPVGSVHKRMEGLTGQPPDLSQLPTGCSYPPRCPKFIPGVCDVDRPAGDHPGRRATGSSATCSARKRPPLVSALGTDGLPAGPAMPGRSRSSKSAGSPRPIPSARSAKPRSSALSATSTCRSPRGKCSALSASPARARPPLPAR